MLTALSKLWIKGTFAKRMQSLDQHAVCRLTWSWTDLTSSQFLSHFFLLRIIDVENM